MTIIKTKRLILRPWKDEDLKSFAKMNSDHRVMEFFPSTLSPDESDALAKKIQSKIEEKGFGFWAVSVIGGADFIGFIGLNGLDKVSFPAFFVPAVEIGWRLAYDFWKQGYATEGAMGALNYGFENLNLKEIVAFTAVNNLPSRAVMERLGMHYSADFENPKLPKDHPLSKNVLYRITQKDWQIRIRSKI